MNFIKIVTTLIIGINFLSAIGYAQESKVVFEDFENKKNYEWDWAYRNPDNIKKIELISYPLMDLPDSILKFRNLKFIKISPINKSGFNYREAFKKLKHFQKFSSIDLSDNQITDLAQEITKITTLREINISGINNIILPKGFNRLKNLQTIHINAKALKKNIAILSGMNIEEIFLSLSKDDSVQNILKELTKLKKINLSGNCIDTGNLLMALSGLHELSELTIDWSMLKIPKEIGLLKNLKKLNLSDMGITKLPKEFGELANLEELILSHNNLQKLPEEICKLKKLKKLNLSNNNIQTIPHEITRLKNIEELDLSFNQRIQTGELIGKLLSLKRLFLRNCNLLYFPENINKLVVLNELDLSENNIYEIPFSFGKLKNLVRLNLSGNIIREIPQELKSLVNIEYLNLSDNDSINLMNQIGEQMQKLRYLNLSCQRKKLILHTTIGILINLEELYISGNKGIILPNEIEKLQKLKIISLDNNDIEYFPPVILKLKKLRVINLMNNQICEIPDDIGKLGELRKLNFQNNKIKKLPYSLCSLQKLTEFGIYPNPIDVSTLERCHLTFLNEDDFKNLMLGGGKKNYLKFTEKEKEQYKERYLFLFVLVFLCLILIFLLIRYFIKLRANLKLKVSQKKLRKTYDELEDTHKKLKVTYDEHVKTQKQLLESEKMASLGQLVSGVAHEINTPVGNVITISSTLVNLTKLIEEKYKLDELTHNELDGFINDTHEIGDQIMNNMIRASDIVRSFKQISADQITDRQREFNLRSYLSDIIMSLKPTLMNKNVKINIDCEDDIELNSYPGVYAQIITNLVINSMVHGFRNFTQGEIKITGIKDGSELHLRYSDNGVGITADIHDKIFEPFFTTGDSNCTGLGMTIIYTLVVHKLKGTIQLGNENENGFSLIIRVPFLCK